MFACLSPSRKHQLIQLWQISKFVLKTQVGYTCATERTMSQLQKYLLVLTYQKEVIKEGRTLFYLPTNELTLSSTTYRFPREGGGEREDRLYPNEKRPMAPPVSFHISTYRKGNEARKRTLLSEMHPHFSILSYLTNHLQFNVLSILLLTSIST